MFRFSFIIFRCIFSEGIFCHQCFCCIVFGAAKVRSTFASLNLGKSKVRIEWVKDSLFFFFSEQTRFQFRCECWCEASKRKITANNGGRLIQTTKLLEFCCHCPLYIRCSDRKILYCVIRATGRTNRKEKPTKSAWDRANHFGQWLFCVSCCWTSSQ